MENGFYLFNYTCLSDDRYAGAEDMELFGYCKDNEFPIALPQKDPCRPGVEHTQMIKGLTSLHVRDIVPFTGNQHCHKILEAILLGYGYSVREGKYLDCDSYTGDLDIMPFDRFFGLKVSAVGQTNATVQFWPDLLRSFSNRGWPGFVWYGISGESYRCVLPYTQEWSDLHIKLISHEKDGNTKLIMR